MKRKTLNLITLGLLFAVLSLTLISCGGAAPWHDAIYKEDTTLGSGAKSITVLIVADENSVTLSINTDAEILGDALYELGLVNDRSFFNVLNGVLASWEKDQAYWAFYLDDKMSSVGISDVQINGGESFKFVYTK